MQQEKEEKCIMLIVEEKCCRCYWYHCLPRKSKGINSKFIKINEFCKVAAWGEFLETVQVVTSKICKRKMSISHHRHTKVEPFL